jgi:hypothetical protein
VLPLANGKYGLDSYFGEKLAWQLNANCKPSSNFKQYLKIKESLIENNYNLTEKPNFFEDKL